MREYDEMIARQVEQAGVRMASGQHIDNGSSPHTRHRLIVKCEDCGITGGHMFDCPTKRETWLGNDPWVDRRDHYDR